MQKSNFWDAKKQASRYKVATFGVQSYTHHGAKLQTSGCNSKFFRFQFELSSIHQWRIFDWKYLRLPSDNALLSL